MRSIDINIVIKDNSQFSKNLKYWYHNAIYKDSDKWIEIEQSFGSSESDLRCKIREFKIHLIKTHI